MVPGGNCIKVYLPGKSILGDYFQGNMTSRRPFLSPRTTFPGRPIFYNSSLVAASSPGVLVRVEEDELLELGQHPLQDHLLLHQQFLPLVSGGHAVRFHLRNGQ